MKMLLKISGLAVACFCCLAGPAIAQNTAPAPVAAPNTPAATAAAAPNYTDRILTPPALRIPRINGPSVYGERPGRPFLYGIPATGNRPMAFYAIGLPKGLTLNKATGLITGSVAKPGTYNTVVRAKNALGLRSKAFTIIIGDKIALTPPMGWNSWNSWAWKIDQQKVLQSARAFKAAHLDEHGWSYINIDDTWQGLPDPNTQALMANERFPDMKAMAASIHAMGLKVGLYSTPWVRSYAGFPGGSADNPERILSKKPEPGSNQMFGRYAFDQQDADEWAQWGFDYLKYDWNPNDAPHVQAMAQALKGSGRDFVFSLSNAAPFEHAADWARMAQLWRTTGDITDTYESIASNGFTQSKWAPYAGPGHWNDPDMLEVGAVGWGDPKPTRLNADEQYTHISLWCLLDAPLLIGADMSKLDPFTLSLLTNDEVLAVDQDAAGQAASMISHSGDSVVLTGAKAYATHGETDSVTLPRLQIWAKPMSDGSQAVGLFNLGSSPAQVTVHFADLSLSGQQSARDLWRQKTLGKFTGFYTATVNSHGVDLVKITPTK